jgi:hypothetical protein
MRHKREGDWVPTLIPEINQKAAATATLAKASQSAKPLGHRGCVRFADVFSAKSKPELSKRREEVSVSCS